MLPGALFGRETAPPWEGKPPTLSVSIWNAILSSTAYDACEFATKFPSNRVTEKQFVLAHWTRSVSRDGLILSPRGINLLLPPVECGRPMIGCATFMTFADSGARNVLVLLENSEIGLSTYA